MLVERLERTDELPLQVRAAIERIVLDARAGDAIRAVLVGDARLCRALLQYAPLVEDPRTMLVLGRAVLPKTVARFRPERLIVLCRGPLDLVLARLRATSMALAPDLPASQWRELGYARFSTTGFQGVGSLLWSTGERFARVLRRPSLADRCRLAMIETLPVHPQLVPAGAVLVREYRSVE